MISPSYSLAVITISAHHVGMAVKGFHASQQFSVVAAGYQDLSVAADGRL